MVANLHAGFLHMTRIADWNSSEIEVARSAGGVIAVAQPWDGLVRAGVVPWPPPELVQKVYQSRQVRAFRDGERDTATRALGFYSDLQSMHSEDAMTWSVFGTVANADLPVRRSFAAALLQAIGVDPGPLNAVTIWLWRRLPHPDTLVPGGPEIDFGIQSDEVFLLGEAKWLSPVGAGQGKAGNSDQLALRREFCTKYGRRLLPKCRTFVVLAVSPSGGVVETAESEMSGVSLALRDTTWATICALPQHPLSGELQRYLAWKSANTRWPANSSRRNGSASTEQPSLSIPPT